MWDIYVIGDVRFLGAILNGIAMIFAGDSIWVAAKIFLLLSVLHLGINAVLQNSFMQVQYLAISWMLLSALFVPRVGVNLHDRESLLSRQVAGVPIGLAVFASFTSSMGKQMAQIMEQAFTTPQANSTTPAVTQSFEQLLQLRARVLESMLSSGKKPHLYYSWNQYLEHCTNVALDLPSNAQGAQNLASLLGKSLPEALRLNSEIYYVRIRNNDGREQVLSCNAAFNYLKQQTLDLSRSLGRQDRHKSYNLTSLNRDITSLSNGHLDAQKYIMALSMAQIMAQQPDYTNLGAAVLSQSLADLYSQWSLQGNIFTNTVKPLLTFLEGFFYAIVPFVFLLLMLGQFGYRMLGKFIMLLVWLQMWQPIISVINLYYQQSISRSMLELENSYIAVDSFWGITLFNQKLEAYLSTSGMLLSSVGSLALFLVYGGAVAATSLASKLAPAVPSASATLTPSVVQSAPVVQASSSYTSSAYEGTHRSGAQAAVGVIGIESSRTLLQNAQETLTQMSRASLQTSSSQSQNFSQTAGSYSYQEQGQGSLYQESSNKQESMSQQTTLGSNSGYSSSTSHTTSNNLGLSGGAGLGGMGGGSGGKGGVSAGMSQVGSKATAHTSVETNTNNLSKRQEQSTGQTTTSLSQTSSGTSANQGQESRTQASHGQTYLTDTSSQYAQQAQNLQQTLDRLGANQNLSVLSLAQNLSQSPQAAAFVQELVASNPSLAHTALANQQALRQLIPDSQQRQQAANLQAIFADRSEQGEYYRAVALYAALNGQAPTGQMLTAIRQASNLSEQTSQTFSQVWQGQSEVGAQAQTKPQAPPASDNSVYYVNQTSAENTAKRGRK